MTTSNHTCAGGCREYATLSRRRFLGLSGVTVAAASIPAWLPRVALARSAASDRDVIVNLFLRGGADGLSLVPPHGDAGYYAVRPTLAIPPPGGGTRAAIDLDGFFGLAPGLGALLPAWQDGHLAIIHATGLPQGSRSHFDAMYFMEVGQFEPPASLFSGWLGRHLATTDPLVPGAPLRALGLGYGLQRSLVGAPATLAVADPAEVDVAGWESTAAERRAAIAGMYQTSSEQSLRLAAASTLATVDLLRSIDFEHYHPAGDATYPDDELGHALRATAALIKAEIGVEAAGLDLGGWDTHEDQGPHDGGMYFLMQSLGQGLAALHADLFADDVTNVVVVVSSEFGRNAIENSSLGTDHGTGGAMLVLGGHVNGGHVFGSWPGLAEGQLFEGQDLATTTDYRHVLAEIVAKRLGNPDLAAVFPDPAFAPVDLGVVR